MKLQQGQIWKKDDEFIRLVHLERLSVEYKVMKGLDSKLGTHLKATKKDFCRLIKGALLYTRMDHSS